MEALICDLQLVAQQLLQRTLLCFKVLLFSYHICWNMFTYLPPPRRLCFRRCFFLSVCLLATLRKTSKRICMKFSWRVGSDWPMNERLHLGGDPYPGARIPIRIRIRIWIRIHIVTVIRRALAEVCTVPVLLVAIYYRLAFKVMA